MARVFYRYNDNASISVALKLFFVALTAVRALHGSVFNDPAKVCRETKAE